MLPSSFTTVEAPIEKEGFWPFGPTDKQVELFDGAIGEETGGSAYRAEKGPVGGVKLWRHITRGFAATIYPLAVVEIIHYMLLISCSSFFAATVPSNPVKQLDFFCGITSAEDGLALKAGPPAEPWNGWNSG